MYSLNKDIEVSFEFVHDVSGAIVVSPTNARLYVVRPGKTAADLVVGAQFVYVSPGVYKTTIPGSLADSVGLLVAFATGDYCFSRKLQVLQVGDFLPVRTEVYVPFIARSQSGSALTGVGYVDVLLSVESDIATSRAVLSTEFVQLQDYLTAPTPVYMVLLHADEVAEAGTLTYTIQVSGMYDYAADLTVGDPGSVELVLRTHPELPYTKMEILFDDEVVATGQTDTSGEYAIVLPAGSYKIRMTKTGLIFSSNNQSLVVESTMQKLVIVDSTHTQAPQVSVGFCNITFKLLLPNGQPLVGTKVMFYPKLFTGGGGGVIRQPMAVETNFAGEGEISLMPGLQVVVNVEGTRLHEEFTVPNVTTEDLFNLITFADKGFDYYVNQFQFAIRRTLN